MGKVVCIYHGNCTDGTTAAAVLLKKYPDCILYPMEHGYKEDIFGEILKNVDKDTTVYIVDFSLKEEDLKRLLSKAKEVINIDHHISAKDYLKKIEKEYSNFKFVFDNNKSGASLSWEYIFGGEPPWIIKYVEDQDLWKWEYGENTKYVNLYLLPITNQPEKVVKLFDEPVEEIINKGKIIASFTDYLINRYIERAKETPVKIGQYTVKAFNTNYFQSEIGNILATKHNQAVLLFNIQGLDVKMSFRSNTGHKPDALELATILGGGGHRNAAGALVPLHKFIKMIQFEEEK
ncbi:Oligoribonuclease NrnB or cAMP/cGMP phosphodiesterase, DHH superfamily [Persephonella hydrogeniphila]|uniref:Oligoribonuclease NrnB or cAMP/cGMP phosphodiesterase, DHH superfamily n=1 Tax=Persephonella hydrogeniphila TaxID=198703 RepID=A0A285NQR9_9AQUI|nr:DHHA1 domain-containing protein [Persephonella hydrogeniphila]SNZ09971.1 Oligoribonuclease NrnB or cAMP/cGMP phosphodiesterase, DHH superfamily [Persephonella hydrogeniphila]